MNKQIVKFLEFNGKNVIFLSKNGTYWIAIKPVCEALGVNYNRQFQNISNDPILGPAFAIQQMQVPGDQSRKLACLPEYLVYGWIFSINSDSPELLQYKKECYRVLFDYFHGTITSRRELLREKAEVQRERVALEEELRENDSFKRFEDLRAKEARIGKSLKRIDEEELSAQMDLFS